MTKRDTMLLAAFGSLALLLGAFVFQALGYAPCQMCLWQRWPHAAAIALGGLVLLLGPLALLGLAGALAALSTAGIGLFHTGVERGWWEGPASCSGGGDALQGLSGDQLLSLDAPSDVVMCDEVAWALFGLSMASWNALASLTLAGLWLYALTRPNAA
ncbi:MAG: disulfide bond formation protein B [Paracoccaceae bacterium]